MLMHFHAYVPYIQYICVYLNCLRLFLSLSFFPPLSLVYVNASMAPKCKSTPSQNPLRFGASFSSDPTPFSIWFRDEAARKDFLENFSQHGVHLERRVILIDFADTDLPDVIHSQGWESLCDILVTCPSMSIQEFYSNMYGIDSSIPFFHIRVRGMRIVVTLELVSDVLCVSRVKHLVYPGYEHLRIVSKNEMISTFCECPTDWGSHQFTPCKAFAKSPRFMNIVMTFVLHPLSHYNSITEPRARFLLSLLEHLTIDFPSHFILSNIDVYRDMATRDKLIFPSAIMQILCHFSVPFPSSDHFPVMCGIDYNTVKRNKAQFRSRRSSTEALPTPLAPSIFAPSSSMSRVTLEDIMVQLQRMDARLDTLSDELCRVNTHVGRIARH